MRTFRKMNLMFAAILLFIGCGAVFGQSSNTTRTNTQKNQDTFDVNTATLEETQKWLKQTLIKYGKFTTKVGTDVVISSVSSVDSVKFKGCEMSYQRSTKRDQLGSTFSYDFASVGPGGRPTKLDSSQSLINSDASTSVMKIKLEQIDVSTIYLSDISNRKDFKGKSIPIPNELKETTLVYVNFSLLPNSNKNSIVIERTSFGRTLESDKYDGQYRWFIVTDKDMANHVKDALVRLITLCQQNP